MLTTLLALVVAASALWVYWDATRLRIGRIQGRKGLFNMSAEAWALVTLFLWVVGFPAYLYKRNALIEAAKTDPVVAKHQPAWFAVLGLLGAAFVWNAYTSQPAHRLPGCGATATKSTVKEIMTRNLEQSGIDGAPTITWKAVRTTDSGSGIYHCKALVDLELPGGRTITGRSLRYTSSVTDGDQHLVEIKQNR